MTKKDITEEREHWNKILNIAITYACSTCKMYGNDNEHCTAKGCSIKWVLEKQKQEAN